MSQARGSTSGCLSALLHLTSRFTFKSLSHFKK